MFKFLSLREAVKVVAESDNTLGFQLCQNRQRNIVQPTTKSILYPLGGLISSEFYNILKYYVIIAIVDLMRGSGGKRGLLFYSPRFPNFLMVIPDIVVVEF